MNGPDYEKFKQEMEPLLRKAKRWAQDNHEAVEKANPDIPSELDSQDADFWRPLLAIADVVGGDWPEKARAAAIAMTASKRERSRQRKRGYDLN